MSEINRWPLVPSWRYRLVWLHASVRVALAGKLPVDYNNGDVLATRQALSVGWAVPNGRNNCWWAVPTLHNDIKET